MAGEPLSSTLIERLSPPRPPLPSKRLVIRSRKASARLSGGLFSWRAEAASSARPNPMPVPGMAGSADGVAQPREQPGARSRREGRGELGRIVGLFEDRPHFRDLDRDVLGRAGGKDDAGPLRAEHVDQLRERPTVVTIGK